MTANQIAYAKQQEEARHNRQTEGIQTHQAESQRIQAQVAHNKQLEDARHNLEQEKVNWWSARETGRHNYEQEGVSWFQAQNAAWNDAKKAEATLRQAAASERNALINQQNADTLAYNAESSRLSALAGQLGAQASFRQSTASLLNAAELTRHNMAYEDELNRSNVARELENTRSNQARERETFRSNFTNQLLESRRLTENRRSNMANESVARRQAAVSEGKLQQGAEQLDINRRNASSQSRQANAAIISSGSRFADSLYRILRQNP